MLLEAGAEIDVPDDDGVTPWALAKSKPRRVQGLLRRRPLVKGPSAAKGMVSSAQPHSTSAE